MAKLSSVRKNNFRRKLVEACSSKRLRLKNVIRNKDVPPEERFLAVLKLSDLPRNSSRVRVRNRCFLTGRPRSVYRKFGLSRIALRELASDGKIPGLVKAS